MTVGLVLVGVQLLYFSRLDETASYWHLLVAFIIGGTGMALTMTPSAAAAMRAVSADRAGVGSAVLNSSRQVGGSLGVALMGAIVAHSLASPPTPASFVEGFSNALVVASIIAFVGAAVAVLTVRHQPHDDRHVAPEPVA